MNKIKVVNDNLEVININKNINIEFYEQNYIFGINGVKINISKSTDLELEILLNDDSKLNFDISLEPNVKSNIYIITKGNKGKIQYKYSLNDNSICNVLKFQNVNSIKEMVIAKLSGINSDFEYNFKTLSHEKETYDYHIFHDAINTISNIKNNGICINNGSIIYQVSSFVPKNITGCTVNQNNRIINLTNQKSEIKPNLYIDTHDVEASHSALIGKFSDEEMFYMQSRGIDKYSALKLLITGFLQSDISNKKMLKEISKNIKKYWR